MDHFKIKFLTLSIYMAALMLYYHQISQVFIGMSIRKLVHKIKLNPGGCLVHPTPCHIEVDIETDHGIEGR
jgi:hypothetical protein